MKLHVDSSLLVLTACQEVNTLLQEMCKSFIFVIFYFWWWVKKKKKTYGEKGPFASSQRK